MTVAEGWVYFFLGASALSLIVALYFRRLGMELNGLAGMMKRGAKYAAVALLAPTAAFAQSEPGGEASLKLPDLSSLDLSRMDMMASVLVSANLVAIALFD